MSSPPPPPPHLLMPVATLFGCYIVFATFRITVVLYMNYVEKQRLRKLATASGRSLRMMSTADTTPDAAVVGLQSQAFFVLLLSAVFALIGYAYTVAIVDNNYAASQHAQFDPYSILGIPRSTTNTTEIKAAYRDLAAYYHPENNVGENKGRAEVQFRMVVLAYQALTEDVMMKNYQAHGHPNGPIDMTQLPVFMFKVPVWIRAPPMNLLYVIYAVFAVFFVAQVAGAIYVLRLRAQQQLAKEKAAAQSENSAASSIDKTQSVSIEDIQYLTRQLSPTSSHIDVLMAVISTPENVAWATESYQDVERKRAKRKTQIIEEEQELAEKKRRDAVQLNVDSIVDEGGWEEDGDEDDDEDDDKKEKEKGDNETEPEKSKEELARDAERQKQRDLEMLRKATGKAAILCEGLDEGILGQQWVEKTLGEAGAWPMPDIGCLGDTNKSFTFEDKTNLTAMEHPGIRRMLCMTAGRLNAQMLNTHDELLKAGSEKRIDPTYFEGCVTFRNRVGMLLEACLRTGIALRSKQLVSTIIDVVVMFRIGCYHTDANIAKHKAILQRQYGILPQMTVTNMCIVEKKEGDEGDDKKKTSDVASTGGKTEFTTDERVTLKFNMDRPHAENFLKVRLAQCQRQGVPPQMALQGFREGWWCLISYELLQKSDDAKKSPQSKKKVALLDESPVLKEMQVAEADIARFEKAQQQSAVAGNAITTSPTHLVTAWPMMVMKIAQKNGEANIDITLPSEEPGKYRVHVLVKSQDYLAADQEFQVDIDVKAGDPAAAAKKKKKTKSSVVDDDTVDLSMLKKSGNEGKKEK